MNTKTKMTDEKLQIGDQIWVEHPEPGTFKEATILVIGHIVLCSISNGSFFKPTILNLNGRLWVKKI